MKNYLLITFTGLVLASCGTSDKQAGSMVAGREHDHNEHATEPGSSADSASMTTIEWIDPVTQDLGNITKGQVVEISWKFKNTGSKPLTIESVQAGCGCTTPEPPKEPIAPGAEGVIKAKFNSENFSGHVTKDVTVAANNSNRNNGINNRLSFTADIKE